MADCLCCIPPKKRLWASPIRLILAPTTCPDPFVINCKLQQLRTIPNSCQSGCVLIICARLFEMIILIHFSNVPLVSAASASLSLSPLGGSNNLVLVTAIIISLSAAAALTSLSLSLSLNGRLCHLSLSAGCSIISLSLSRRLIISLSLSGRLIISLSLSQRAALFTHTTHEVSTQHACRGIVGRSSLCAWRST